MNKVYRRSISFLTASWMIIILNIAVICFHILVLVKIVPYQAVWGGRLKTVDEMYVFESISIVINLLLILVVLMKMGIPKRMGNTKVINVLLWIYVIVFLVNTLGNLTAVNKLERFIATPVTFLLAILCWRAAIEPRE